MENGEKWNISKFIKMFTKIREPDCIGDFAILDGKNNNKIASFGFSKKDKMINERSALFFSLESITFQKFA